MWNNNNYCFYGVYLLHMQRRKEMSSFRDRFGGLTVGQAIELNKAAEWYCSHEVTAVGVE